MNRNLTPEEHLFISSRTDLGMPIDVQNALGETLLHALLKSGEILTSEENQRLSRKSKIKDKQGTMEPKQQLSPTSRKEENQSIELDTIPKKNNVGYGHAYILFRQLAKNLASHPSGQKNQRNFLNATIDNTPTNFVERSVKPDGDCGFTALKTDRKTLVTELRLLKDDINARDDLAEEIANAFITYASTNGEEGLKPSDEDTWTQLLNNRDNEQNALDTLFRNIRNGLGSKEAKQLELSALIDWLRKNHQLDDANALSRQDLKVYQANVRINIHCKNNEVFDYYLTQMENTKLWLGYKSILLYAKQPQMPIAIVFVLNDWVTSKSPTQSALASDLSKPV